MDFLIHSKRKWCFPGFPCEINMFLFWFPSARGTPKHWKRDTQHLMIAKGKATQQLTPRDTRPTREQNEPVTLNPPSRRRRHDNKEKCDQPRTSYAWGKHSSDHYHLRPTSVLFPDKTKNICENEKKDTLRHKPLSYRKDDKLSVIQC